MRIRGVLTGYLGLIVLYTIVQTQPANRLSGLLGELSKGLDRLLDPNIAGIGNHGDNPAQSGVSTQANANAASAGSLGSLVGIGATPSVM